MIRSIVNAPRRVAIAAILTTTLLLVVTSMARAETVDESELRSAAGRGNSGEVARLLAAGTDPDVPDHTGRTALHHAAENAQARILNMLLEAGGDPDVQDRDGSAPLHLAALFPYFELDSQVSVRTLLGHRANPDLADRDGRSPLHLVAGNHQQATSIRDLLSSGADVNAADRRGDAPLHYAVGRLSKLSADVVAALVSGGADGTVRGGSGETPLQLFVRDGSNDGRIVDALVDAGADVDAKNPEGESPLHTAIRNGGSSENNRVVEALLAAGADPCIKDASGYIPYNTAREGGEVHTMLANAGGSDSDCQGAEVPVADYVVDPADWPGELTTRANIRSGPGTDHDVANTLAGGTSVHVTGTVRSTDWLRVDVAGATAFVHASLVEEFAPQDEAGQDLAERTEEASHMKTESWKQPICVNEDGDMVHIQLYDLYPALEVGTCVGAVEVVKTTTCDTRTSACVWPCPQGDQECYAEWTSEPEWPYEDYEDDARAVAATARRDAASTRDQGLAAVLAFHEFLRRLTQGEATDGEDTTAAIEVEEDAAREDTGSSFTDTTASDLPSPETCAIVREIDAESTWGDPEKHVEIANQCSTTVLLHIAFVHRVKTEWGGNYGKIENIWRMPGWGPPEQSDLYGEIIAPGGSTLYPAYGPTQDSQGNWHGEYFACVQYHPLSVHEAAGYASCKASKIPEFYWGCPDGTPYPSEITDEGDFCRDRE